MSFNRDNNLSPFNLPPTNETLPENKTASGFEEYQVKTDSDNAERYQSFYQTNNFSELNLNHKTASALLSDYEENLTQLFSLMTSDEDTKYISEIITQLQEAALGNLNARDTALSLIKGSFVNRIDPISGEKITVLQPVNDKFLEIIKKYTQEGSDLRSNLKKFLKEKALIRQMEIRIKHYIVNDVEKFSLVFKFPSEQLKMDFCLKIEKEIADNFFKNAKDWIGSPIRENRHTWTAKVGRRNHAQQLIELFGLTGKNGCHSLSSIEFGNKPIGCLSINKAVLSLEDRTKSELVALPADILEDKQIENLLGESAVNQALTTPSNHHNMVYSEQKVAQVNVGNQAFTQTARREVTEDKNYFTFTQSTSFTIPKEKLSNFRENFYNPSPFFNHSQYQQTTNNFRQLSQASANRLLPLSLAETGHQVAYRPFTSSKQNLFLPAPNTSEIPKEIAPTICFEIVHPQIEEIKLSLATLRMNTVANKLPLNDSDPKITAIQKNIEVIKEIAKQVQQALTVDKSLTWKFPSVIKEINEIDENLSNIQSNVMNNLLHKTIITVNEELDKVIKGVDLAERTLNSKQTVAPQKKY